MNREKAFSIVYEELIQNPMFKGLFDATHGNVEFMYGVCTVMENIAINVNEDTYDEFSTLWWDNFNECLDYAEEIKHAPSYLATVGKEK